MDVAGIGANQNLECLNQGLLISGKTEKEEVKGSGKNPDKFIDCDFSYDPVGDILRIGSSSMLGQQFPWDCGL